MGEFCCFLLSNTEIKQEHSCFNVCNHATPHKRYSQSFGGSNTTTLLSQVSPSFHHSTPSPLMLPQNILLCRHFPPPKKRLNSGLSKYKVGERKRCVSLHHQQIHMHVVFLSSSLRCCIAGLVYALTAVCFQSGLFSEQPVLEHWRKKPLHTAYRNSFSAQTLDVCVSEVMMKQSVGSSSEREIYCLFMFVSEELKVEDFRSEFFS